MTDSAKFDLDRRRLAQLRKIGVEMRRFFDVGGSDGAWTWHISQDFPEATFNVFEPLLDHAPAYREELEKTLQGQRFRVHKVALGAQNKRTKMFMYPGNLRGSTALDLPVTPKEAEGVEVEMLTMDRAVDQLRLPIPQVVKIDAQGCELSILQGARETLPGVSVLILECWLVRAYGQKTPLLLEVANFVRQFDFHLWDFAGEWRDADGSLGAQDCFFLNARSAGSKLVEELRRSNGPLT
jgi:FkbM family methyltransferase